MEHNLLIYHVARQRYDGGYNTLPRCEPLTLVFVCQNIADVNNIRPDYKMKNIAGDADTVCGAQTLTFRRIRDDDRLR